jgi:hypothetical protein
MKEIAKYQEEIDKKSGKLTNSNSEEDVKKESYHEDLKIGTS